MSNPVMPTVTCARSLPRDAETLVVGLSGNGTDWELAETPALAATLAHKQRFGESLAEGLHRLGASATANATTRILGDQLQVIAVGLGEGAPDPQRLRSAAGAAARLATSQKSGADQTKAVSVCVALPADEPELISAVVEGAVLGQYAYQPLTADPTEKPAPTFTLLTAAADKATKTVIAEAATVAEAQLVACEWVNLPPNLLYPQTFAEQARDLVRGDKVSVEILDDKQLAKGGYGGLTAVGGGSSRGPRLVRLSYSPRGAKAHLALVGKGITFDSGGLNLKPGDSMSTMKCDMGGAAAVLAAVHAIAELGLQVKVTAYACMAENLPSDTAYRPSDVLTIYGGTTVENYNTDAEGRLVMADGLARSNEDHPDLVVDVATLTGACMVALGGKIYGVFSDSDAVAEQILDAAESAGEQAWRLPMGEWSAKPLESKVADLRSGGMRLGGASVAASFLRHFVDEPTSWAHLDIAGVGFNEESPAGEIPAGGTGAGTRTLVELARAMQTSKG